MWLKINSHRAREKAQQKIKMLELVNWDKGMQHYYLTYDKNKPLIEDIKGITILKSRPKGEFTQCW